MFDIFIFQPSFFNCISVLSHQASTSLNKPQQPTTTETSPNRCSIMNPLVWGPSFWFVMHTVSLNYPDSPTYAERRTHYDFYHIIRNILPCEMCRQHYRELIKQFPVQPFLDSKASLVSWVVMIHNQVNERLGKPMIDRSEMLVNYEQVYARGSFCDPACPAESGDSTNRPAGAYRTLTESVDTYRRALIGVSVTLGVLVLIAVLIVVVVLRRRG